MKKNPLASLTGIFLLSVISIAVSGQVASTNSEIPVDFVSLEKSAASIETNKVSEKAVRDFEKTFKKVSGEKWFEVHDGFIAMFNQEAVAYQVAYDKKGNWLRTIRSYSEAKLSEDIRHMVKSDYYDYDINLVQEVQKPMEPSIYIIQLIGKTELIKLSVRDGEMQVLQKYNKSE